MGVVAKLLEQADLKHPPQEFIWMMGLRNSSYEFQQAAWELFKERRETVSVLDVRNHLRKLKQKTKGVAEELEVSSPNSHFLDSGSFALWGKAAKFAQEHGVDQWKYYDTPEFYAYCDRYVEFVKEYAAGIDLYANVDVIPNPELTWRNQQYLEDKGLSPVPVVHYRTDLKWLEHYIDRGYPVVALGGLVGSTNQESCRTWIDRCFDVVCATKDRTPKVKVHGFGVTSFELMFRYPWWSVDSTSWAKVGGYGGVMVPHRRGGKWVFNEHPYIVKFSLESPDASLRGRHYLTLKTVEQAVVRDWLAYINVPLGAVDGDGQTVAPGVLNSHTDRQLANLKLFEELRKHIPPYPWAWRSSRRPGFGLL